MLVPVLFGVNLFGMVISRYGGLDRHGLTQVDQLECEQESPTSLDVRLSKGVSGANDHRESDPSG
jgi:hypothetical protein